MIMVLITMKENESQLTIGNGRTKCQIEDPFGNLIGLLCESNDS